MTDANAEPVLPLQAPASLAEKIEQVHQQRVLLAELRASDDPELMQRADALQELYHARDAAALSADVYRSAAHEPAPPGLGWIRVTEHPELLKERLGVDWSEEEIAELLQPFESDFRAEIYLPDPRVYGPEVEPFIAYKGSNGMIAVPDGKGGLLYRNSAIEDWAINVRQGIGLESDHADRAMKLAVQFKLDYRSSFEFVGHSKAGADASACATLTGMRAYTYNAAGLHPNTVPRYIAQHGGQEHDIDSAVHSYYVDSEVLHDVQTGVHGMGFLARTQLGIAAQQLGQLGQLPELQGALRKTLAEALPYDPKMQQDALELLNYLASHPGPQLLKGMPLAAGVHQIELPAKMRDEHGDLVDRPVQPSLGAVAADAGPLMNVVSGTLFGGVVGKQQGEMVAVAGRTVEQGMQWAGATAQNSAQVYGYVLNEAVQGHGRLVAGAMHYGGAAVADLRLLQGHAEATLDRGAGKLAELSAMVSGANLRAWSHVPGLGGLRSVADRQSRVAADYAGQQRAEAATAIGTAQWDAHSVRQLTDKSADQVVRSSADMGKMLQDGTERAGESVNGIYRGFGSATRNVTDHAPTAGAAVGAVGGATVTALGELANPLPYRKLGAYRALQEGPGAVNEALQRHSAADTVLPSIDARVRELEHAAMERFRELRHPSREPAARDVAPENHLDATLQSMLQSATSGNWDAFRQETQTLAALQPGRDLHADAVAMVNVQEQAAQEHALAQQMEDQQRTTEQALASGMGR